jgi:hypothetical protein
MSKSWFYLGIISSLAILTSSCGGDGDKKAAAPAPATSPAPAAAPTAPTSTAAVPTPTNPTNPATPATTPDAAAIKPVSPDVAAGLIPSTEAENWSRTVAKGRPDPFAVLALQPVEIAIENTNPQAAPVAASSSIAKKSTSIQSIPTQTNPQTNPKTATKITTSTPGIKSGVDKPLPEIKISTKLPNSSTASGNPKIAKINSAKGTSSLPDDKLTISAIPRSGINRSLPKIEVAIAKKPEATKVPATTQKIATKQETVPAKPSRSISKTKVAISPKSQPTKVPTKVPTTTQKIATKQEVVAAKPLQAMAIEISGMIDVAGKTQVIIKLPTESFSRYVEVGERILNGKVLVKRVEGQNSLSPTVVLEEVGVEVPRKIGDKSTPATPEAAPKP